MDPKAWLAIESGLATALALFLAVRLHASVVWLALPLVLLTLLGRSYDDYGLEPRLRPPSFGAHVLLGGAALLAYSLAHALLASAVFGERFDPGVPGQLGPLFLHQLVVVALPEEVFFRGYLQTNLNRVFGRAEDVYGAAVGPGLVLQASVFALCHLATGDWTRLVTFFFGLLAGWLRERSGSILPAAIYHALGNVSYRVIEESFRGL
jgi:CAAX protease family protein